MGNAEYMGTHPIFESDFDCLTGCCLNWPVPLLEWQPDLWPVPQPLTTRLVLLKLPPFWKTEFWELVHPVILKKLVKSWLLVTVLLVSMVLETSKPRKWLNSPPASRVWPCTWKEIMLVLSFSVTIDSSKKVIPSREPVLSSMFQSVQKSSDVLSMPSVTHSTARDHSTLLKEERST